MLPFISPEKPIYRIARKPDPWSPPDWSRAHDDRTFGNRFDDSEGYFRVLYAGSSRLTCFLETLSRYRKPPASQLKQELEEIIDTVPSDLIEPGTVPGSWLTNRTIGRASLVGKRFADIYPSPWVAHLRKQFEPLLIERGVIRSGDADYFDLSLLMSKRRSLTQQMATHVYNLHYNGIYYQSRHGKDLENWAVFEPFDLEDREHLDLRADDPEFKEALAHFELTFDASY